MTENSVPTDFERVLVVHAHPDDETIVTGATLATLVDAGAHVTVVTCTRGELGEVMPDDLASLRDDPTALAVHREGEIRSAMQTLGVTDHRFLGSTGARTGGLEPRAYRDSGMAWGPRGTPVPVPDLHPAAFCAAEFGEIVSDLAAVVADVQPDAIVSYDADGGYGHPDHVRVNRASLRVARLSGVPFFAITAGSIVVHDGSEPADREGAHHPVDVGASGASAVAQADVAIDGRPVLARKVAALRAYRTQVHVVSTPGGPALQFPHGAVEPVTVVETFRHVPEPEAVPAPASLGATDLSDFGLSGTIVTYALALVVGALFGAIGSVAHQDTAGGFPFGVLIALALVAALMVGFRLLFETRLVALVVAIALTVVNLVLSQTSQGGSVLIPGNTIGYAWIGGSLLIAAIVLVWPKLPPRARPGRPARGGRMDQSPQAVSGLPDVKGPNRP